MSRLWNTVNQWLYPPAFRIKVEDDEAGIAVLVTRLMAALEPLERSVPEPPASFPAPVETQAGDPGTVAIDRSFAIEMCNQIHRLSRSVNKVQEQGGTEADKLRGHLDRLGKILDQRSVKWEDLSGQVYHDGREDFDPLGEPKITPGLLRKTIIACERPVVRMGGAVIQTAKGVVGKPVE